MFRRLKRVTYRRLLVIFIIIPCIISFSQFISLLSLDDEQILYHKSAINNVSDTLLIINLIDQFLDTKDFDERDELWLLLVKSWSKSFENYLKKTEIICSSTSSLSSYFVDKYLNQYTKKLFLENLDFQRRLTGFGLFFDYNPKEIRSKTHPILSNIFLSPCIYFELIVLIMRVQLALFELNIDYFIGENTLIGALRHHDIVPWHSIIEFNLSLTNKEKFLKNINKKFELISQEANDSYINKRRIGFIYKIFLENKIWPQIQIYFYQENPTIFPLHLRPFGPILLHSTHNPQAMISNQKLNICESLPWNHQLGKQTEINHQWRMPCEQLETTYSFVQTRYSWRQGYCEETLKTKRAPFRTLSYFRYTCHAK